MNNRFFVYLMMSAFAFAQEDTWKRIQPGVSFDFPRDHGSHPAYQTEWWYVTGHVTDEVGNEYGYQFTIFRIGLMNENGTQNLDPNNLLAGHFAVADIKKHTFLKAERIRRAGAGFVEASEESLHTWIGDWEIKLDQNNPISIIAADREQKISLELELEIVKPPVFHGKNGYSQKGSETGNASAYYSWTRLATAGTLMADGTAHSVKGISWFDHEWGSSQLGEGVEGWDWFGLHLDDGSELMLYQLRNEDGSAIPQSSATLVHPNGDVEYFNSEDWVLSPKAYWKSKITNGNYPIEWQLSIPKQNINITIKARLNTSEMVTKQSTGVTYWEGPVAITGSHTGRGYMELTGYAGIFTNTF